MRCTACRPSSWPTKPLFHEVVDEFLAFIGDAPLVIHNASFDIGFINAELDRIKRVAIPRERLVDTLLLARRKHPGVSNRLDDLCSRYAIDNSRRTKHGALLDAELLGRSLCRPDRGAAVATDPGVGKRSDIRVGGWRYAAAAADRAARAADFSDAEREAASGLRRNARRQADLERVLGPPASPTRCGSRLPFGSASRLPIGLTARLG